MNVGPGPGREPSLASASLDEKRTPNILCAVGGGQKKRKDRNSSKSSQRGRARKPGHGFS